MGWKKDQGESSQGVQAADILVKMSLSDGAIVY